VRILRGIVWLAGASVLFGLLFSGCATMAAHQEESRKYQALADQATHALGSSEVSVNLVAGTVGSSGGASCATSTITLGRDGTHVRWLLAHELGHHFSGHCGQGIESEMAANAAAIRVLQVWGFTEQEAYRMTVIHLIELKRYRGDRPLPGHDYCAELRDIERRYPNYTPEDPGPCRNDKSQPPGSILAQADIDQQMREYHQETERANREYLQDLEPRGPKR